MWGVSNVSMSSEHEPKKSLGQNFLVSKDVAARIAAASGASAGGLVLEIGPGHGALTVPLAETGAHVVAFEIDGLLAAELEERLAGRGNVEIIHADITEVDLDREAEKRGFASYTLVGNIPYNLTSTILLSLPGLRRCTRSMLMVQREVADRILTSPGKRNCGILTVFLQSYMDIVKEVRVLRGSFRPRPKVESVVLGISPAGGERGPGDRQAFLDFVKRAFSQRRKMLSSIFRDAFGMRDAGMQERLGARAGVDMKKRPEQLSLEQWFELFGAYRQVSTD
jgi:16S rRNA (adenine1518-N6/adenine1519-N6)-dimethyltransferase